MSLKHYFKQVISPSPRAMLNNAIFLVVQRLKSFPHWRQDLNRITYLENKLAPPGDLFSYFAGPPTATLVRFAEQIKALTEHYLAHRFDLLGSGWVEVKHGMNCRGLEGHLFRMGASVEPDSEGNWLEERINGSNLPESQRIWRLVSKGYVPIDWHLDFKSGYRWSESTWYLNIRYGHKPGVDVKVPWELARMQHLPQLAWAYGLAKEKHPDFLPPYTYSDEFRNQFLDFVATNPPRFGANWHMTMDVAIRAVNWLVAYDLFRVYGADFDEEFNRIFLRSIYEHGRHILTNLEWSSELRGNHYLANIMGLLFVAAYLPMGAETDGWLAFAVQELIKEVGSQFNPDGSNFEASTSYHRLAGEMVIYGTALVLCLPTEKREALKNYDHTKIQRKPGLDPGPLPHYEVEVHLDDKSTSICEFPFPSWYFERLGKMAEFIMHVTKPDGHISQIGDNDNGRFLKLQPVYHQLRVAEARQRYSSLDGYTHLPDGAPYWDEDHLDHKHLVAAINGFFGRDDFTDFTGNYRLECELIQSLARGNRFTTYLGKKGKTGAEKVRVGGDGDLAQLETRFSSYSADHRQVTAIEIPGPDLREGLQLYAYPDFGLYLFRSNRMFLALRCGAIGQNGNGGHAHNDQLSLELNVDGEDWIVDPGTYLYTPLPERRNQYRSVRAHFAPRLVNGNEPGQLDLGLFQLGDQARGKCLYFGLEGFIGVHWGYGEPVYRQVRLKRDTVVVTDVGGCFESLDGPGWFQERGDRRVANYPPSHGYGCRARWHN